MTHDAPLTDLTDLRDGMRALREAVQELRQEVLDLHAIAQALSHRLRRLEEHTSL